MALKPSRSSPLIFVTDFGADPTGTNDSAAAINNAWNSGIAGDLWWPPGTYKINSTIIFGDGTGGWNPVATVTITTAGLGYTANQTNVVVPLTTTSSSIVGASGAKASVTTSATGAVTAATIPTNEGGHLFTVGDTLTIATGALGSPGTACVLTVATLRSNGAISTKMGLRNIGIGVASGTTDAWPGVGTDKGVRLLWGGASGGVMVAIQGPLRGWGFHNFMFDSNAGTAGFGIVNVAGSFGNNFNLSFHQMSTAAIYCTTRPSLTLNLNDANSMRNRWEMLNIVHHPTINNSVGIYCDGGTATWSGYPTSIGTPAGDNSTNTCYEHFKNVYGTSSGNGASLLYLRNCDTCRFEHLQMSGSATLDWGVTLDYTGNTGVWPVSNLIDFIDSSAPCRNVGPPSAFNTDNYMRIATGNAMQSPKLTGLQVAREKMTQNVTLYINNGGSDTLSYGRAPGTGTPFGAFKTIAFAVAYACQNFDTNGFDLILKLDSAGPGTGGIWNTAFQFSSFPAGVGRIVIDLGGQTLNVTSPTAAAMWFNGPGVFLIQSSVGTGTIQTTTGGDGIRVSAPCSVSLGIGIQFGPCAGHQIHAIYSGSQFYGNSAYTITGATASGYHLCSEQNAAIVMQPITVTMSSAPSWLAYAYSGTSGSISMGTLTVSGSTAASGIRRYIVEKMGVINTGGQTLPGQNAGIKQTGGTYT